MSTEQPDRPWAIVTAREINVKLTDRSFILSTVFISILIIAGIVVSGFVNARSSEETIATSNEAGQTIVSAAQDNRGDSNDKLTARPFASADEARKAIADDKADAALIYDDGSWTMVQDTDIDSTLEQELSAAVRTATIAKNAEEAGTSLSALTHNADLSTDVLESDGGDSNTAKAVAFVFAFLFYMSAIIFGMAIANSVLEEKQNRIVEILATSIPIRQLLYGKVMGNSLLAFAQLALYGVLALVAINFTDLAVDVAWITSASGWFIAFFVVGFMALAAIWAVLGSLASRSEDLQSNTSPVIALLVVILFVGLWAEGTVLAIASYIPIMSAVAMPVRLLQEDIGLWQPIVALVLTILAAYLLVRLAERIYERAVMQTGSALSWRQALKLEV